MGSGPGIDRKILRKYHHVIGSDNSTEFIDHQIGENPNGVFLHLDAITLITGMMFDGIYANKVMHHLKDNELVDSLKRQYEILNPKGLVCHSYWRGEGSEVFNGLFVNYHNESNLRRVYKEYFEIISIDRYTEFEDEDSLVVLVRKYKE